MVPICQKNSNGSQTKNAVTSHLTTTYMVELFATTANHFKSSLLSQKSSISDVAAVLNLQLTVNLRIENNFVEKTKSNFGGINREIDKFCMQKWCEIFKNSCVFWGVSIPLNLHRQKLKLKKTKSEKTTDVLAWTNLTSKDTKKIILSTIANIV